MATFRPGSKFEMAIGAIGINRKSIFSLVEAQSLLPIIRRLTKSYSERVQSIIAQLESSGKVRSIQSAQSATSEDLEAEASRLIEEWQSKVQKLGGLPKGLWIVDFDSGSGYFCWKYPEAAITHWHHYRDGFTKRRPVEEMPDLDWSESLTGLPFTAEPTLNDGTLPT